MTNIEVKAYKVNSLVGLKPDSFAYLKVPNENKFEIFVTDKEGIPYSLKQVTQGLQDVTNTDGSITITGTLIKDLKVSDALQNLINSALQAGDNVSELVNDAGYITNADLPTKTSDLSNDGSDNTSTYVETDELGATAFSNNYYDLDNLPVIVGSTNLSYTASPTNGSVNSDTGTDATIPLADITNAGLLSPGDKTKLENTSGTNTGDNSANTTSNAYADTKVAQTLTDGVTDSAPSQNVVFDALALKENLSNKTSTVAGNESSTSLYLNILGAVTYFQQKLTDVIFGTFINSLTSKTTPIDADSISIVDSADSNKQKKVSLTNFKAYLKTYFDSLYNIPQITITTATNITTATTDGVGNGQKGRNVVIDNGVTAINITVNGGTDFVASYVKHGTANITFVQGSGRTLTQVDNTAVLSGAIGSTATISSVGTRDYLRISNA